MISLIFMLIALLAGLSGAQQCTPSNPPTDGGILPVSTSDTNLEGDGVPFAIYRQAEEDIWVFYKDGVEWKAASTTDPEAKDFTSISLLSGLATPDVAVSVAFIDDYFLVAYRKEGGNQPSTLFVDRFYTADCSNSQSCSKFNSNEFGESVQTPTLVNLQDDSTALMWLNYTGHALISTFQNGVWSSPVPLWDDGSVYDGAISASSTADYTLWAAHIPTSGSQSAGLWNWALYGTNDCGAVEATADDVNPIYSQGSILQMKSFTILIFASKSDQQETRLAYAKYDSSQLWFERGFIGNSVLVSTAPSSVLDNKGRPAVYFFVPDSAQLKVVRDGL